MFSGKVITIWLLASILLAACQPAASSDTSTATSTDSPTPQTPQPARATATQTPTKVAESEPIEELIPTITAVPTTELVDDEVNGVDEVIEASDGLKLASTFYAPLDQPPPWPGVVLIHMLWGNRSTWDEIALQLAEAGFAVLSIDLRGHGETGGEVNWDLAVDDLQQVWNELAARPDIDQERIVFIGASIGANLALIASANEPAAQTVVLLSPGLSYAGVKTEAAMQSFGDRPVLIAASQEDTYAANSSVSLEEESLGASQLIIYQDAGHGIFMFQSEPKLMGVIVEWLNRYLK